MTDIFDGRRADVVIQSMVDKQQPAVTEIWLLAALLGVLCGSAGPVEAKSGGTVEARHCLPMGASAPEELRELDAAAELLGQSGYFGTLMRMSGVEICVDPLLTLFHGHYEPDEHVIVIGANASVAEKALILAHELRHVDQAARGYAPSIEIDMRENIRQIYALEADAQAITVLFAWSMREAGNPALWRALKTLEHAGDIASPFEAAMLAGAGQTAATRAAFSAWYRSRWRVENYFTAGAGAYLDQLDEAHSVQSYRKLPRNHFDRLCLLPNGGNYACRPPEPTETIQGMSAVNGALTAESSPCLGALSGSGSTDNNTDPWKDTDQFPEAPSGFPGCLASIVLPP